MDRIDWEKVTKGGKEQSGKDFQTCKIAGHAQDPGRQEGVQTVQTSASGRVWYLSEETEKAMTNLAAVDRASQAVEEVRARHIDDAETDVNRALQNRKASVTESCVQGQCHVQRGR